jgi:serine/threonine protein kinase
MNREYVLEGLKFKIIKELGRGSFGEVYKCEKDSEIFACKILHPGVVNEDLKREYNILKDFSKNHPDCEYIEKVFDLLIYKDEGFLMCWFYFMIFIII